MMKITTLLFRRNFATSSNYIFVFIKRPLVAQMTYYTFNIEVMYLWKFQKLIKLAVRTDFFKVF